MLTKIISLALPETNSKSSEHLPSQKESSLPTIMFEGRAVSFRGSTSNYLRDDSIIISDLRIHTTHIYIYIFCFAAKMGCKNQH